MKSTSGPFDSCTGAQRRQLLRGGRGVDPERLLFECDWNAGVAHLDCTRESVGIAKAVVPGAAQALLASCTKGNPAHPLDRYETPGAHDFRINFVIDPGRLKDRVVYILKYRKR